MSKMVWVRLALSKSRAEQGMLCAFGLLSNVADIAIVCSMLELCNAPVTQASAIFVRCLQGQSSRGLPKRAVIPGALEVPR